MVYRYDSTFPPYGNLTVSLTGHLSLEKVPSAEKKVENRVQFPNGAFNSLYWELNWVHAEEASALLQPKNAKHFLEFPNGAFNSLYWELNWVHAEEASALFWCAGSELISVLRLKVISMFSVLRLKVQNFLQKSQKSSISGDPRNLKISLEIDLKIVFSYINYEKEGREV